MNDTLGDAMKAMEAACNVDFKVDNSNNIYVRVDGRSFHTWVKKAKMTFADPLMVDGMKTATLKVADDLAADFAYVQSDEASFGWLTKENPISQHPFGGRVQKLATIAASLFSTAFFQHVADDEPWNMPVCSFDGRVVWTQDRGDFQKIFYWRFLDAKRNAINAFAQSKYSHKSLQGKSLADVKIQLREDGLAEEFDKLDPAFRLGSFYIKRPHDPYTTYPVWASQSEFVDAFRPVSVG